MLSFQVDLREGRQAGWEWTGDRWRSGAGWVKPFRHPRLTSGVECEDRYHAVFGVSEYTRGLGQVGDFVSLDIRAGSLSLEAGPYGTAPVYLRVVDGVAYGSWRIMDLLRVCPADELVDREVVRLLTRRPRYTSDTMFAGIVKVTERAVGVATPEAVVVTYPEPAAWSAARRVLEPGEDPVATLDRLIARSLAEHGVGPGEPVGIELSGGARSGNVAASLTASRGGAAHRSYGLIMAGDSAKEQCYRRRMIAERFGLDDTAIQASGHLPFNPGGRRFAGPHDPASSYYCEAFDALRSAAALDGITTILTGFGGDEVLEGSVELPSSPPELPGWLGPRALGALAEVDRGTAPAALLATPALLAFTSHNPAYLDVGIWPVAPLAHPALSRFTHQLPSEWVVGKRLLSERLRRHGLPLDVAYPARQEDFRPVMQFGLRARGLALLEKFGKSSLLADLEFVDLPALNRAARAALTADQLDSTLADLVRLEVGLRSLRYDVTSGRPRRGDYGPPG